MDRESRGVGVAEYLDSREAHLGRLLDKLGGEEEFVEQMDAHLRQMQMESDIYTQYHQLEEEEIRDRGFLLGAVFEKLVEEEMGSGDKLQNEILALMHDPNRYGLQAELGSVRNPDLAMVDVTSAGRIIIKGAREIKLGQLDYRAFDQLNGKFRQGFEKLVQVVNTQSNHEDIGLFQIAQRGGKMGVARDFRQVLVVPADRDIGNPRSMIKTKDFKRPEDVERFVGMISSGEVTVLQSKYSSDEVVELSEYVLEKIRIRRELV